MAELLIDEIRELAFDEKIDITVWKVKKDKDHPHGLKYSFNYRIWNGNEWIEVIRFDNAHGGGDHIHLFGKIKSIKFISIGSIMSRANMNMFPATSTCITANGRRASLAVMPPI